MNDTCAPCHAKAVALTRDFTPGDRYFDHFDLVCLEDPDFYPDGRDLGENYTFTLWRMSPCVVTGELDCIHCHTSSGRYRFATENPNGACLPCHEERVANASAHTHHPEGSAGKSVHLLPHAHDRIRPDAAKRPLDAAACPVGDARSSDLRTRATICHADQDADWADEHVRAWHERRLPGPDARGGLPGGRRAGTQLDPSRGHARVPRRRGPGRGVRDLPHPPAGGRRGRARRPGARGRAEGPLPARAFCRRGGVAAAAVP